KHRTVLPNARQLTPLHLLAELGHVVWSYGSEELDVVVAVVFCHLLCSGFLLKTYIDLHFPVQSIVEKQVVSHPDAVRFHRMPLSIVVISDISCKGTIFGVGRHNSEFLKNFFWHIINQRTHQLIKK
uniref:Uncharacterized protein n=1 Tax=Amphiprion ocellaris TaxID=80972 RepID=A0A3Q1AUH0_AMPOC